MSCRETNSLWFWLKHHPKEFIKRKIWKAPYFYYDSFGKYLNRVKCFFTGHRNVEYDECVGEGYYCLDCGKHLTEEHFKEK